MTSLTPRKIVHIDLSQTVPSLPAVEGYAGVYAVFWWKTIPLGHQDIAARLLPLPVTEVLKLALDAIAPAVSAYLMGDQSPPPERPQLKAALDFKALMTLEHPLSTLMDTLHHQLATPNTTSVSVIICTRDRPEQLETCLRSLQQSSQAPFETVVVDNAPTCDATRQLVSQFSNVKYVLEPRPGLSVARNSGIHHSTGEIIAFTDDDVVVHPDWLKRLQQGFHHPHVMAVTGLVLADAINTEAQFIFEHYWSFNQGYRPITFDTSYFEQHQSIGVPVWRIGAGANMAMRRKAFELVGNFDERLGAGASGCSEDSELWYRLLTKGWICQYEPTAVIYHHHRRDMDSLHQQIYSYTRGHVAALLIQFEKYGHLGNLRRLMATLPKWYVKLLLKGLIERFQYRSNTIVAEVLGYFSGIGFYLNHRSAPPTSPARSLQSPSTVHK